jgi:hypothetical protein
MTNKLSELKAKWEKECVDNKLASGYTFFGLHASHLDELILEAFKLGQDDTAKQIFDEIDKLQLCCAHAEGIDTPCNHAFKQIENLKKRWVK